MSESSSPQVSVIVVSYNTCDHLRKCLASLQGEAREVIVVDNASRDGSPEMVETEFPWVHLLRSSVNLGFGRANNLGLDEMKGDLALLLNSDAVAEPGAIAELASVFAEIEIVAAGGQLLNSDGSTQESACGPLTLWAVFCEQALLEKLIARLGLKPPYWRSRWLLGRGSGRNFGSRSTTYDQQTTPKDRRQTTDDHRPTTYEVAQVMGACLMLRRELAHQENQPITQESEQPSHQATEPPRNPERPKFDPHFFLYCEDTELCHRLSKLGTIVYVPTARFTHALGASTSENRWWSVAMYNRGKELFFSIHHGPVVSATCLIFNRLGALLRLLLWALMLKPRQVKLFWRVLTAPICGPSLPTDARLDPS